MLLAELLNFSMRADETNTAGIFTETVTLDSTLRQLSIDLDSKLLAKDKMQVPLRFAVQSRILY